MKGTHLLSLLMLGLLLAPMVTATEGRAAPQCAELDLSDVISSGNGVAVDPGACAIVSIGVRTHSSTLAIDYQILDDAMDVLLFDSVGILTYENGQSYRNNFVAEASFESFLGTEWFDWRPPVSGSEKSWFIVFDNQAHDGDQGMGDQGGMTGRFKLQLAPASTEDHQLYHDTIIIPAGERVNLASDAVDSGTGLTYWVHSISGDGELFIQSDNQLDGDLRIAGTDLAALAANDKNQNAWTVPEFLDLQNLNLMAEAGTNPLHLTVKAWFEPVLDPQIVDHSNGSTNIDGTVTLDARGTPDSLQHIQSYSWDFDSDGITDAQGELVDASWDSPGLKTVNLTVAAKSGETTVVSHQINVVDDMDPVAVIGGNGQRGLNGEWRVIVQADLILTATGSTDDHRVDSSSWNVDGSPYSEGSQVTVSWSMIGTHTVTLTVLDPSGNSNSVNTTIVVYEITPPILDTSSVTDLDSVHSGESVELRVSAVDAYDDQDTLLITWDLDLTDDANFDGDPRNDPDVIGNTLTHTFDSVGTHSIAVTVVDGSGNKDFEVLEIKVVEAPEESSPIGIVAAIFAVIIIVCGVVLYGHRGIQRNHAMDLLMEAGLTAEESSARIENIIRTTKLPIFAKAADFAGISEGGEVKSAQVIQSEAKAAEMQAIYGGSGGYEVDPNAGFRPSHQVRQVDSAFADAALAAFADEIPPQLQTSQVVSGKVKSGGVALPRAEKKEESHTLKNDCSACGKGFTMSLPDGVNSAVIACPSCGVDQFFER